MTELLPMTQPPEHVEQLLAENGMTYQADDFQAMSLEQHADEGFKGLKVSVLSAVYSGMHFAACQREDRKFVPAEAERRGVSKQSIYDMIDVFNLVCRSPEKIVQTSGLLGFSKLVELKKFNEEDLSDLANGKEVYGITLEAAQTCSVRELRDIIKSHRSEVKNLKQKILDAERKMNVEAETATRLLEENRQLKQFSEERRTFVAMREQLFADMEAAQGIIVRARKTFETAKHFQKEVEAEAIEAVIHPLLHLLSVLHGGAKLVADDCHVRWNINPAIPVNPPMPNTLTHDEKWKAQQSAIYQASITDNYLPNKKKSKALKSS